MNIIELLNVAASVIQHLPTIMHVIPDRWHEHFLLVLHEQHMRLKDSYSCEMRMCGTVECRPTLAYGVHFDSINISDWTDYKILLQREIGPMLF